MKIKYLGTAAAEGVPALFCECEVCKKARQTKGKNIRSRSQMLINDDLIIDYPQDSFYHFVLNNIDISKIKNLIISHVHGDHFYPDDFEFFLKGYSTPISCLPFTVHGSVDLKKYVDIYLNNERNQGLKYQQMDAYKTYNVGKYFVTPLKAIHGTEHPYIYIISDGIKTMLYHHDSALLNNDTFEFLREKHFKFNLLSLDCNYGNDDISYPCHMNVKDVRTTVSKLKQYGLIDDNTKIVVNHFSHNGKDSLYEDMCKVVENDGFIVSYDGLEIEF